MGNKIYKFLILLFLIQLSFEIKAQIIDVEAFNACNDCVYYISERSLIFDDGGEGNVSQEKQKTTYRAAKSKDGYELSLYFSEINIPKGAVLHITYGAIGSTERTVIDLTEVPKMANIKAQEISIEYFSVESTKTYSGWSGKIDIQKTPSSIVQSISQLESDCPYALPLCANNTAVALGGQYTDLGAIVDEDGNCYGDLGNGGSVWYSFSPLSSGPLDFRINPQGSTDYDFVLWDITNGCESGKRSQVSCNYSRFTGATGLSSSLCGISEGTCTDDCSSQSKGADCTRFNNRVNVTVGRRYAVCINFYSGSNDGFVIKFQNEAGSVAIADNTPPTLTSALTPNCNNANSFNIKFSEWIDCSTLQDADLTIPGRTVTITANNCTSNRTNNITINVNPPLTAGSYTLTGQNILDLCGNNMNSSFNIVIGAQPNPSITPPVPVCKNPTTNGGTVNSPNNQVLTASGGTTYLWSTGATTASVTVNQAATRTYTVTAYNGACYASASTTVVVQQANPVSLGPDKFYCGTPVTITANPAVAGFNYQFFRGANLTTNGTSVQNGTSPSLTVSPANNTTYRVIVTDAKGCKAQDDIIVKVTSATGNAVITVPGTNFCPNANPVLLTASPDGGTFSGPGIVGDYFYPSVAGVGNHAITYTTTNACGTFNGTKNIRVINGTLPNLGLNPTYCVTSADVILAPTPKCGTYTGPGIITTGVCNAANTSYSTNPVFSPAAAGVGSHVITYSGVGCGNSFTVNVLDVGGVPTITGLNGPYCTTEPPITLNASPVGGIFSGPGISGSTFTPSSAGVGTHPIKYKIASCSGFDSVIVLVQVVSSASAATISYGGSPYCQSISGTQNVTLTGTSGGAFSATPSGLNINASNGAINPSSSVAQNYVVTYAIPGSGSCPGYTTTANVTITAANTPTFNPVPSFCSGAIAPILPGTSINGINGTWSPTTIDNLNSGTYTFTPNAGVCANSATINTTVNSSVTPTFAAIPAFCSGDVAPILPLSSIEGISGTWSPAVVNNTSSANYIFTPNAGQCASNTNIFITVNSAGNTPVFNISPTLCNGSVAPILPNTSTNGIIGTWSPATVSNSIGGNYVFTPNAGQCAQSTSVNINVLNAFAVTVPAQICTGQTFTLPDGSIVNSAGNYPVTLTAINGCDSVVTTNLTVVNTLTTSITDTICQGSSYTLPDGSTVNTSGTFTVLLKSIFNCDSLVQTNLTVLPVYAVSVPAQICTGQTFTLPDGSIVNSAGNFPVTLTASNGCDSVVTTNLTVVNTLTTSIADTICQGSSYTLPDGSLVNSGGSFAVTLLSSGGCDSVVTVNLTVVASLSSSFTASICNGDTYTFPDGSTFNTAGIYNVTLQSVSGCDSIVTLNLSIKPNVSTSITDSICSGNSYLLPDGTSVSSGGIYTVKLVALNGCDSTITINLKVNSSVNVIVPVQICSGQSYTLPNGTVVNTAGIYPVTLLASTGCDSIVTINISISGTLNSLVSAQICIGQSYTLPDGTSMNSSGTFTTKLTSSGGCDSIVTTQLDVVNALSSSVNVEICSGQLHTLPDGVVVGSSGIYVSTILSAGGCDSIVTTNLTVYNTFTTFKDASICTEQSYTLPDGVIVNTAGTFSSTVLASTGCDSIIIIKLSIGSTVTSTSSAQICFGKTFTLPDGIVVNSGGIYTSILQSSGGCDSIITTNLLVTNPITTNLSAQICSGKSYTLPDGVVVSAGGIYTSTLTSSDGCDSVITTNLTVVSAITQSITAQICAGKTYTLPDGVIASTSGIYSSTLISSGGCDSIITTNLTIINQITTNLNAAICFGQNYVLPDGNSVNSDGIYVVTLSSSSGCDSIITVSLKVNDFPQFTLGPDTLICEGSAIIISVEKDSNSSYVWQDGSTSSSISIADAGIYYLTVTNDCGSITDSIEVIVDECIVCGVYAPNAFSPNGDGVNDIFTPLFTCNQIEPYLFRIYNRWNEMMFESSVPGIGWNAVFEGEIQPTDSYIYYISYFDVNKNKTIIQKGAVRLLR